ncbi:methyltransferase, FxLD system [Streptomyces qinzhouensis]|uniref:Protein-L-isoaspartate O-methyltransferase n=1 Tax=Streptomyces qinzhouensis TaxID=2599401 RepID=A0A5B8IKT6_9ACTN|nr:methyltransferase, FxLD system [Streptomyces qinzhouensis]QDY79128.1 methyltransferase, FxLD system [Streptomyces qinzhouensis]
MTTVRDKNIDEEAASLRAAMVRELRDLEAITADSVAGAVAAVPRHLFAVGEPLKAAYAANQALVIKRDEDGTALSSLSATHIQAVMLEQAGIEPGMRVLEVGSGGYNAALIAELVGKEGASISVDIDAEIVERARKCLDAAGYEQVQVVRADAVAGVPELAPFDRIIVTAGAWDIPSAWLDQLSERGRIVVPLRMRGLTRSIAFDRAGGGSEEELVSDSYRLCGFVPMQGAGAYTERLIHVTDGLALRVDDQKQDFDTDALAAAVRSARLEVWSGAAFDLPDELELFLATNTPEMVMLHGSKDLVDQGLLALSVTRGVPALVSGGSFAYRTKRANEETGGFESGVLAHGPDAEQVAARYAELLRRWASDHQRRGAARISYRPMPAGTAEPSQGVVAKRLGAVAFSWS